ncbi:hypothetical protein CBR_g23028 [Chara braunii]|uniref:MAGE domain-containing protein n=1 Tax=Chara braunii TaxID=69332 RepID=A0A388L3N3_CHABU|nr:hypothetical protein CBR_g23028 [Chara braunii]|eukprot:GBG76813.1 hypothetical protein CBR_g23028 [Chara braunii]
MGTRLRLRSSGSSRAGPSSQRGQALRELLDGRNTYEELEEEDPGAGFELLRRQTLRPEEEMEQATQREEMRDLTQKYEAAASQAAELTVAHSITPEETDNLVAEVMRYMIFKNFQQPSVPVKREELNQIVNKQYKERRQLPGYIIALAQAKFPGCFGMEMREVTGSARRRGGAKERASTSQSQAGLKLYVLRSMLPADLRQDFIETDHSLAYQGLAMVVMSVIDMAGDKISEDSLWRQLTKLGVRADDDCHPAFGNVENMMQMLAKQRYVVRNKEVTADGDTYFLELGENAMEGVGKERLQNFVSKILKD